LAAWDPEPALRAWSGRTMVVSTPIGDVPGALYRIGDGLPCERIESAGHWVQLDEPTMIANRVDAFIRAVS
jgi:pimeloyl-ACP methyl ester carboxylesterase